MNTRKISYNLSVRYISGFIINRSVLGWYIIVLAENQGARVPRQLTYFSRIIRQIFLYSSLLQHLVFHEQYNYPFVYSFRLPYCNKMYTSLLCLINHLFLSHQTSVFVQHNAPILTYIYLHSLLTSSLGIY